MIKRTTKITALLVATTSLMSIVPVMASERLGTKDGTINYGIAFDEGKYIYDGYRTDDDDTGIYYNGGDKDKLLDDLEDYEFTPDDYSVKYGNKYALAKDGTDEYLVDLSTGKIADDETDEEKRDSIQGKLRSKLKKTDRYSNTNYFDDVKVEDRLFGENNQFGDVWYMYTAKGDENYTAATTTQAASAKVTVALPTKGTVIDYADGAEIIIGGVTYKLDKTGTKTNTASIIYFKDFDELSNKVIAQVNLYLQDFKTQVDTTNVTKGSTIFKVATLVGNTVVSEATLPEITLTSAQTKSINSKFGNSSVTAPVTGTTTSAAVQYTGFVNEDGKYIDASNLANIYAYSNEAKKVVKIEEYNDYDKDNQIMVTLDSIKPIAQDKDYIYTITTANIYQGATEETCTPKTYANKRTAYFYQKISKNQGDKKDDAYIPKTVDSYEIDNKSFYDDSDAKDAYTAILTDDDGYEVENNLYTIKNGTLYVVRVKDDEVKVFKMKTKKAKVDAVDSAAYITDVTKKLDAPLLQKDDDNEHDIFDGAGKNAVSIDVDGNVWALDKGAIYKVDGTDFKEVYTLDRSINNLDVYNDGSLIAWENDGSNDGDVYTTVTEGKAVTDKEAPTSTPAKVGWDQLADGNWNFYDATGAKIVNNWTNVGGTWYFLNADGIMATGWQQIGGTWYYLNPISDGTKGAMLANTTVNGYKLNASGAWIN